MLNILVAMLICDCWHHKLTWASNRAGQRNQANNQAAIVVQVFIYLKSLIGGDIDFTQSEDKDIGRYVGEPLFRMAYHSPRLLDQCVVYGLAMAWIVIKKAHQHNNDCNRRPNKRASCQLIRGLALTIVQRAAHHKTWCKHRLYAGTAS